MSSVLRQVAVDDPRLLALVRVFAGLYANGAVYVAAFDPADGRWEVGMDRVAREPLRHWQRFLGAVVEQGLAADLAVPDPPVAMASPTVYGGYELEATMVTRLLSGGAYARFPGSDEEARAIAWAAVDAMLGDGRLAATAYATREAWTRWFNTGPWDQTLAAFDPTTQRWWLVCLTDTD